MSHIKPVSGATSGDEIAYSEAFELLDSGLCIFRDDGSVAANNQAFSDLLNLPPDWSNPVELAEKTLSASEELVAGWVARVSTHGNFADTVALPNDVFLRVKGNALVSGGVSLSVAEVTNDGSSVADIHAQTLTQKALQESEAKFHALFDGAGVGIILVDADGVFLDANPAIAEMLRLDREEIIGQSIRSLTVPEDIDRSVEIYDEMIAGKRSVNRMEKQYVRGNGEHFTASINSSVVRDEQGNFLFSVAVIEDITERKQTELALHESEARFRSLIDNLPAGLTLKDTDHNVVLVNRQLEEWYGIQADDYSGKRFHDIKAGKGDDSYDDEHSHFVAAQNAVLENGQSVESEISVTFADGSKHELRTTLFPIRDAAGDIVSIGSVGFDVTEQKRAQNALRESEERFRTLVDNIPAGITLKDSEGRLLLTNQMFEQWYDLRREELFGKRVEEVRTDISFDPTVNAQRAIIGGQERVQVEQEVGFADGKTHNVLFTAFPVKSSDGGLNVATIGVDLTEQKKTERLLVESEERFRALVDNLPAGVTLKDRNHDIVFVNGRIEEWYGFGADAFIGKKFHDVVTSHHNESSTHAQRSVSDDGEPVETEFKAIFKDGSEHILQTIFFPVKTDHGAHVNMGMLNFDITDRKRTEEMLYQAQKMQAVGQLTGSIAHDFNNLLSVIIGNLEMVAGHLKSDTPDFYYIRNAFTAAERGASLTHHLLAFSRQQVLQPEETDLERLIFETKELMSISMGEKIAVELQAGTDLWRCKVDQAQLQNAILNLSINARDAMPSGGHLTISAENTVIDADRGADLDLDPGEYVCLSVTDTGSGIPEDVLEHVYEPFFSTKESGVGSGLGLSMVHGFVRQSGGGVDIETAVGMGTTVNLYFPATAPTLAIADKSGGMPAVDQGQLKATIVLVEDNVAFREITRTILESLNYQVIEFGTAEDALTVIGDITHFDLLLSDIGLPGQMNGHDLAEQAAKARPGLKIILMSAHNERQINGGITDPHVSAFLRKPHRKAELVQTLNRVLD